jgi:serine/threonine protein kinase
MTRFLDMVEGVRKAFEQRSVDSQPVLILEYIDGETLRDYVANETLNLRSKLEIAKGLALILAGIHQENVIHLDLNSKNILIGNKQQSVYIIDLGSASHIDRTGQLKVHADQMLGTLPYISPEQTGRINRAIDERSDLYSLIQNDLEICLRRLKPDNTIAVFPVGETDYSSSLRFTQKLYGRDRELKELAGAFESVCLDTSSIVFVGGYSGIGKTALVEELQRPVSEKNGYFIQGKLDQLATTPYSAISQALTRFVSQILSQTETQLAAWRSKILEAAGPNGRVLTDVVPNLELVIGPQPSVPVLSGQEAQKPFQLCLSALLRCCCSQRASCLLLPGRFTVDRPGLT